MCVNMTGSGVNPKMEFIKFLYPAFDDCADLVYPGCWMGKVDLTDGFFHRKVAESSRKCLGLKLPERRCTSSARLSPAASATSFSLKTQGSGTFSDLPQGSGVLDEGICCVCAGVHRAPQQPLASLNWLLSKVKRSSTYTCLLG
jgi:hypothetical protein